MTDWDIKEMLYVLGESKIKIFTIAKRAHHVRFSGFFENPEKRTFTLKTRRIPKNAHYVRFSGFLKIPKHAPPPPPSLRPIDGGGINFNFLLGKKGSSQRIFELEVL